MPGGKAPGGFSYGKIPTKEELKAGPKKLAEQQREAAKRAKEIREGKMEEEPSKGKAGGERKEVNVKLGGKTVGSKPAGAAGRRLPTSKRKSPEPQKTRPQDDVIIEDVPEEEVFPPWESQNIPEPQPFYDPQNDPSQYPQQMPTSPTPEQDPYWQSPQPQSRLQGDILDRLQGLRPTPPQQQPYQPPMQPQMAPPMENNANPFLDSIRQQAQNLRSVGQPQAPGQGAPNIPQAPLDQDNYYRDIPADPIRNVGATPGQANVQDIAEQGDFWNGYPDQNLQLPKFTPEQADVMNLLLGQASQNFNPDYLSQRAQQQYSGQTAPGLAERFSQFGKNSQASNSFGTGIAGTGDLEERLNGLRARIGQSQLGMGLRPSYENVYLPGSGSGLQSLFNGNQSGSNAMNTGINLAKGAYNSYNNKGIDSRETTTPQSGWGTAVSTLLDALAGARLGSYFGPYGTVIGGVGAAAGPHIYNYMKGQ